MPGGFHIILLPLCSGVIPGAGRRNHMGYCGLNHHYKANSLTNGTISWNPLTLFKFTAPRDASIISGLTVEAP